jgi:hypothetical protein
VFLSDGRLPQRGINHLSQTKQAFGFIPKDILGNIILGIVSPHTLLLL